MPKDVLLDGRQTPVCISFSFGCVSGGGLDRKKSPLSDDPDLYDLINEELSGAMPFYYENVKSTDERIWVRFLNL